MKEATSSNTPFTEGMSDIEGAALVDGFGVAKDAPKNDLRVCIPPVGRPAACLLARLPRRSRATPWSLAAGALGAIALSFPALLIPGRRCGCTDRGRLALGFIGYGLTHLERAGNQ